MSFGENLQMIRTKHNITQEQFAEQLEVTRQSVSKWESGASYPEMNTILKICEMYQVSMDELMRGTLAEKDNATNEKFEKQIRKFSNCIAAGVALIISGAALVTCLDFFGVMENLQGMIFMSLVVIAVVLFIVSGMEYDRFTKKYPTIQPYHTEEEIERFDKKFAWMIAGSVGAILIGVIMMCAFDGMKYEDLAGAGFLLIVASAVALMIQAGMQHQIYHVEEYNKENNPTKHDKKLGAICGSIMLVATMVFFLWGFLGGEPEWLRRQNGGEPGGWGISWLAFPIGGMLCGIVALFMNHDDAEKTAVNDSEEERKDV